MSAYVQLGWFSEITQSDEPEPLLDEPDGPLLEELDGPLFDELDGPLADEAALAGEGELLLLDPLDPPPDALLAPEAAWAILRVETAGIV